MTIYVFAGANGSGKSTFVTEFLNENPNIMYICPDSIKYDLEQNDPEYLELSEEEKYIKAMNICETIRNICLENGETFCFETVLSDYNKIEFLLSAKELGYKIISFYCATTNYLINLERVLYRVSQGGHDVPSEKLIKRYTRSLYNLQYLIQLSDEISIYDNSKDCINSKFALFNKSNILKNYYTDFVNCYKVRVTNIAYPNLIYWHDTTDNIYYFSDDYEQADWVIEYISPYI